MAALFLSSEDQIQRLNFITEEIMGLQKLKNEVLTKRSTPQSWSILEIIEHLSIAYQQYIDKVEMTLKQSPDSTIDKGPCKARLWQKLVILSQRPKGTKRSWKMKTLKKFEPVITKQELSDQEIEAVFNTFQQRQNHLKKSIIAGRHKDLTKKQITSAIGPLVKFYLPECFDFVISHEERHLVQIREVLG